MIGGAAGSGAFMRGVLAALFGAAALLVGSDSAEAAAPWLVIVHGSLLDEPVLLDDWHENLEVMLAISEVVRMGAEELEGLRYLDVALFWGADWEEYPGSPEAIWLLSPEEAEQQGRLYPSVGAEGRALFLFGETGKESELLSVRIIEPRALEIFEAHGIPTQIEQGESPIPGWSGLICIAALALVVGGVLVGALAWRRRSMLEVSLAGSTRRRR